MTDSYIITCDDGEKIYLSGQACFMPMKRLKSHVEFLKGKGKGWLDTRKVKSIMYYVGIDDHDLMSRYVRMIKSIKPFKDIILNMHSDSGSGTCVMTLDLNKPTDAVLYTLGALRYIKERKQDQDMIKKILDANLSSRDAGLSYLLMEGVSYHNGKFSIMGDRGHSNSDGSLTVGNALAFNDGSLKFGIDLPYSDKLTYGYGWGKIVNKGNGKGGNFFSVFCKAANDKQGGLSMRIAAGIAAVHKVGGDKVTTVSEKKASPSIFAAQYGIPPAIWPVVERRGVVMDQVRVNAAVQAGFEVPKTIRVGKLDVPINEADWTRRLNPKRWLYASNRQKLYRQGYNIGFRLRK